MWEHWSQTGNTPRKTRSQQNKLEKYGDPYSLMETKCRTNSTYKDGRIWDAHEVRDPNRPHCLRRKCLRHPPNHCVVRGRRALLLWTVWKGRSPDQAQPVVQFLEKRHRRVRDRRGCRQAVMVENEILPIQAMAEERDQRRTTREVLRLRRRHAVWIATFACKP